MNGKTPENTEIPIAPDTILLVEDDPVVLRTAARVLSRLDYEIIPHLRAGEALASALLYTNRIVLLITDMMMPEMNGDRLAQQMQQHLPDLPVLFMSGYTEDVLSDHGIDRNKAHFVGKPFTPQELIDKVHIALNGKGNT